MTTITSFNGPVVSEENQLLIKINKGLEAALEYIHGNQNENEVREAVAIIRKIIPTYVPYL